MVWWTWILLGMALCAVEVLTPSGFYVLFFGTSAVIVGLLSAAGMAGPEWTEWLLFSILSVTSVSLLRRPLMDRARANGSGHSPGAIVGETAVLLDDLGSGGVGKAEFRGSAWTVRSREPRDLARGTRCIVEKVEGLTLWVRSEAGGN